MGGTELGSGRGVGCKGTWLVGQMGRCLLHGVGGGQLSPRPDSWASERGGLGGAMEQAGVELAPGWGCLAGFHELLRAGCSVAPGGCLKAGAWVGAS